MSDYCLKLGGKLFSYLSTVYIHYHRIMCQSLQHNTNDFKSVAFDWVTHLPRKWCIVGLNLDPEKG